MTDETLSRLQATAATVTDLDAELDRKEFIRSFLLQVLLGVEGSYSREYLDAVISDAAYAWEKTERI